MATRPRPDRFLRGLTLGALVGAAIAGSRIWRRRRSGEPVSTPVDPQPPKVPADRRRA